MLQTTVDAIRAVLRCDPTVSPAERTCLIYRMRWGEKEKKIPAQKEERLLRREMVSDRLACSLRTVDKLAEDGVLHKVRLPGRKRATGFRESEVDGLIMGKVSDDARQDENPQSRSRGAALEKPEA